MSLEEPKFTFKCAFRGLRTALEESTFQAFVLISLLVIIAMFWLEIPVVEKVLLLLVIGITLSLELLNSQIERVLDYFCPQRDSKVRSIKDLSAGAVLLMVITDIIIGLAILLPEFLNRIQFMIR